MEIEIEKRVVERLIWLWCESDMMRDNCVRIWTARQTTKTWKQQNKMAHVWQGIKTNAVGVTVLKVANLLTTRTSGCFKE